MKIFHSSFFNWQYNHRYIYGRFNINFGTRILDVGSSYGHNLIHFDPSSAGIETNKELVAFSRSLGLNIYDINVEDDLGELVIGRYPLIWCTGFLVHTVSPYKVLYNLRSLLDDDGRLVLQIPLMSIFNTHRSTCHLYAFNKKSLIYIFEMAGYSVIRSSGFIRSLPGWLNLLLEPVSQIFGGNIWVLAKKNAQVPVSFNKVFLPQWFRK